MIECVCNNLSSKDIEDAIKQGKINELIDQIDYKGCSTCLNDIIKKYNLEKKDEHI